MRGHHDAMDQATPSAQPAALPAGIEIFKAGRHIDDAGVEHVFTDADVAGMAAAYNPAQREAPLCIGHPKDNKPAWGWVQALQTRAGSLLMDTRDVIPAFAELVNAKQYKKRSASFYPPKHPNNPTPGKWYLRHVAFLGAQQPAVAGLADFSAADEVGTVNFSDGDGGATSTPPHPPMEEPPMPEQGNKAAAPAAATNDAALADVQTRLQAAEARAAAAERDATAAKEQLTQFSEAEEQRRTAEFTGFAEGLAQKAVLTPPEKSLAVAAMQALDACSPVEFSEGNTTRKESVLDWFKRRLQVAAPVVQFGEHAPGSAGATVAIDAKTATDEAFDRAVRAHMRAHAITSYAEAAQAVAAGSFTA